MRHVCDQTDYRTTMIHTFLDSPSDLGVHPRIRYSKQFRRNLRPNVHYMALSCSRRGPLRYVCGQTIHPTVMICTFLESPTDLDVHPRTRFALFGLSGRLSPPLEGSVASRLRENYLPYSYDLYIIGKPNRPRWASGEAYCCFRPKSSKLTSPK